MKNDWARYIRTREHLLLYVVEIRNSTHYLCLPKREFASRSDELFFRESG
jgi:hypothetical protein